MLLFQNSSVFVANVSFENESEPRGETHFHMIGFIRSLVLTQRLGNGMLTRWEYWTDPEDACKQ